MYSSSITSALEDMSGAFQHVWTGLVDACLDALSILPFDCRMFIGFVPRKFWNLFWNLLRMHDYLVSDWILALSEIGIILPVCLDIPVYRFLTMFCCLFLCFGYCKDHETMFWIRFRPETPVSCMFYMLNQCVCANFRQIFRIS